VSLTVNAVNDPPVVDAGSDASITLPAKASLDGTVTDVDSSPTVTWTMTSGPGTVTFGHANAVDTTATFGSAGTYVLRLTASDGTSQPYDEVTITVAQNEEFQGDANTIALYNFNTNANDSSGNGYNLTLNGNATLTNANLGWMTNPTGQVLRTSALGDTATISIADSAIMPSGGQSISIEARFYVLLFCMAGGAQLTYPVLSLEMIDMHPKTRGAAASVQSFIALGIGALVMGMVAPMLHGDLKLLAWISLAGGVVAWLAWRAGSRLRAAGDVSPHT
jgi:hypothetical protein